MSAPVHPIIAYLQRHWFRIGIAAVLIFLAMKKDLSFKINLNTPQKMEYQKEEESPKKPVSREILSEHRSEKKPEVEHFEIVSAPVKRKEMTAMDRLSLVDAATISAYIERFGKVAEGEEKKFGIPAAIILANALLHSQAGTEEMANSAANNHFGLPCTDDWMGETGTYHKACKRHYENAWTSFRDHSFYITTGKFTPLSRLSAKDYQAWAKGLEELGFSEEKHLAEQLLEAIEGFGL
ncbi:MAG TPA: glucosaminidase domain-containing protein [Saprospiraceae bacterium]|nr:glucosaminidase domain-containing protein [Saprospiraceae bacterium]HMQ81398.1 glucosaminidase domain-containing protein [Saprospiraceae bacterium]